MCHLVFVGRRSMSGIWCLMYVWGPTSDVRLMPDVMIRLMSLRYLMWEVRRLIYNVRCLMSDDWCLTWDIILISDIRCLTSEIIHLSHIRCLTSDIGRHMSDVWCLMSKICSKRLMYDVWYLMFFVRHLMSDIWCLMYVWCPSSDVTKTHIWYQTSDVWHIYDVSCQTSDICLIYDVWCKMSDIYIIFVWFGVW